MSFASIKRTRGHGFTLVTEHDTYLVTMITNNFGEKRKENEIHGLRDKEGVGCYNCHRVHFQALMNIMISPQLNGELYGVQQQPRINNSSFHYLIIVVSVFLECILLLAVVVVTVLGSLTHSDSVRPCIAAIHYTLGANSIRFLETVKFTLCLYALRMVFPCRNLL